MQCESDQIDAKIHEFHKSKSDQNTFEIDLET